MPSLTVAPWKYSVLAVALGVALSLTAGEARAQAPTYVGTFAITNAMTNTCLTNQSSGIGGSGSPVSLNPWAAVAGQEWAFELLPNGFFAIFNLQTKLYLTAGGGLGAGIGQAKWTADLHQMWYLYPLGGQFYALTNAGNDGEAEMGTFNFVGEMRVRRSLGKRTYATVS